MGASYLPNQQAGASNRPTFPHPPPAVPMYRTMGDPRFGPAAPPAVRDPRFSAGGMAPTHRVDYLNAPMAAPMSAPLPQPGVYTPNQGFYDPPPRPMPMQAPMAAPAPTNMVGGLQMGGNQIQALIQNALQGGGASIQDIIARVAANQRMMQGAMQPPAGAVGYRPY